jgi:hypothetical protein
MERESFEDPGVAAILNQYFVPIKVDREERPDLDDLYMGAVQALAGRGGWPMSVWLTPDLKPFYGGTYFPRESRYGFPGFIPLLEAVAEAWREKRQSVVEDAAQLTQAMERQTRIASGSGLPSERVCDEALGELRRSYDATWGGFGTAPKFPPFLALELILRRGTKGDRKMTLRTLDAMAEGGLFDHLGGGFSRYSVDAQWLVPHFEKMLYDNAQLASTYLKAFLVTSEPRYAKVARETLDYLIRDMQDPGGGFYSSEDADSEGEEGRFYTFTPAEVQAVLGKEDGELFCQAFGVTVQGNFEGGKSILHRFDASEDSLSDDPTEARLDALRKQLRARRDLRVHPHKDDKVLTSWNGLALSAMARGYQVLGDPRYLAAANACGAFLRRELFREGQLLRTWRRGAAHTPGFLEDFGSLILGLVDLYETTFDLHWLRWAEQLADSLRARFEDREGGFFFTEEGQKDVLHRQKPAFDHSLPSANALAVQALLRVGEQLERPEFIQSAEQALGCFGLLLEQAPRSCLGLLQGLERLVQGPVEIVINGPWEAPATQGLAREAWLSPSSRRLIALVHGDSPLHRERVRVQGLPTAYVCLNRTCLEPVTSAKALGTLLSARHF